MLMDPGMVTGPVFCPWRSHRPTSREGDGGAIVSLSAWEQQALDSIRDGLAGSDPGLAALLVGFTRLADGEEMPAREKVRTGSRRAICRPRRRRHPGRTARIASRTGRRLGCRWIALLLGLAITAGLIAVGLVFGGGGEGTCDGSWSTVCIIPAPAHGSRPTAHDPGAGLVPPAEFRAG